ncbi:hypothetical protein L1I79_31875 [Strepomyces sp. STD 3.1]|nr:hypothetical protein [Streptomyces sp. STD 3.1]
MEASDDQGEVTAADGGVAGFDDAVHVVEIGAGCGLTAAAALTLFGELDGEAVARASEWTSLLTGCPGRRNSTTVPVR